MLLSGSRTRAEEVLFCVCACVFCVCVMVGLPGVDGMPGHNGTDGIPGLNGLPGADGKRGKKGNKIVHLYFSFVLSFYTVSSGYVGHFSEGIVVQCNSQRVECNQGLGIPKNKRHTHTQSL